MNEQEYQACFDVDYKSANAQSISLQAKTVDREKKNLLRLNENLGTDISQFCVKTDLFLTLLRIADSIPNLRIPNLNPSIPL